MLNKTDGSLIDGRGSFWTLSVIHFPDGMMFYFPVPFFSIFWQVKKGSIKKKKLKERKAVLITTI